MTKKKKQIVTFDDAFRAQHHHHHTLPLFHRYVTCYRYACKQDWHRLSKCSNNKWEKFVHVFYFLDMQIYVIDKSQNYKKN